MNLPIDFTEGLRHCDEQPAIYSAVLREFVKQYQQPLTLAQEGKDIEADLLELHTLKGLCATIGARRLSQFAQHDYLHWQQFTATQRQEAAKSLDQQRQTLITVIGEYLND